MTDVKRRASCVKMFFLFSRIHFAGNFIYLKGYWGIIFQTRKGLCCLRGQKNCLEVALTLLVYLHPTCIIAYFKQ